MPLSTRTTKKLSATLLLARWLKALIRSGKGQLLKGNQIKLPQLGWLEYVKSREIPDGFVIKQARIVRKASGYFVMMSLECDVSVPDVMPHGHPVGIDLGLDKFVANSDGLVVDRPRFLSSLHRKIKCCNAQRIEM
ncbi:Mobile element protein [uncultured Coleofasciculus sp.]|uniref:Mobile element protein n=1 Tax=uncultured Coleofasciculus sp. TaxID=1267456 RepID=A0A6J4JTZ6_9CYAN|nr:Mobile element protein [uncultured Coleofasciculus sp.]